MRALFLCLVLGGCGCDLPPVTPFEKGSFVTFIVTGEKARVTSHVQCVGCNTCTYNTNPKYEIKLPDSTYMIIYHDKLSARE